METLAIIDGEPLRKSPFTPWPHGGKELQALEDVKRKFRMVEEGVAFSSRFPSGLVVPVCSTCSAAIYSFLSIQGTKGGFHLHRVIEDDFPVVGEFSLELDAFAKAIPPGIPLEPDGERGKNGCGDHPGCLRISSKRQDCQNQL